MHGPNAHLSAPDLAVDAEGTARSTAFDDVYFSRHGGVAETEHVFLRGNDLPARWMQGDFTIGELGFGTGLNFLAAWRAFEQSGASGRLHFLSFEKYPLTQQQLAEVYAGSGALDAGLAPHGQALLAQYPLRLPGLHRITFGRVTLTLGFGEVATLLPQTQAQVDAWFLDGFSPAKNPDMWSAPVMAAVARLSAPVSTLATFTVASSVRQLLQENGFILQKIKGFAHKREMLVGRRAAPATAPAAPRRPARVVVVGAGMAGCTLAWELAMRGSQVTVIERGAVAGGASGNAAAVLYPQLTKYYLPATAWHLSGYGHMLRAMAQWSAAGLDFAHAAPGMLKIAKDAADAERLRSIRDALQLDPAIARFVPRAEASALLGSAVTQDGFYFPQGSWLSPAQLCHALLQHPNITLQTETEITALQPGEACTAQARFAADAIVLANAQEATRLVPQAGLKLGISAGQVSLLQGELPPLQRILCQKGYAVTMPEGLLIGATYDRSDFSGAVTDAHHATNRAELARALPDYAGNMQIAGGRTSLRATTPGRLPYVGEIAPGLWVSVGHGSRGMISAPLAASVIAAQLYGEPVPVTTTLLAAVSPQR